MSNGEWGKNVIFEVDTSPSMHVDNRKNNTLVLGEAPTDESDDATITAAENILLILPPQKKKNYLSLHYNGSNSFLMLR